VRARRADGFGWMCMNAVLVEAIATTNVRKVLVVVLLSLLTLFLLLLVVDFTGLLDGSWREVYLKSRYFFRTCSRLSNAWMTDRPTKHIFRLHQHPDNPSERADGR
jgi:hypothetical protein